jgi:hypothetical protein
MMPSLPTMAHALWILVPRKYRLSATFAGFAYQVSRAGVAGGAPPRPRPAAVAGAGGGGMHKRRNVPAQSVPAATLARETSESTVGAGCACTQVTPMQPTTARAEPTRAATDLMTRPPG